MCNINKILTLRIELRIIECNQILSIKIRAIQHISKDISIICIVMFIENKYRTIDRSSEYLL